MIHIEPAYRDLFTEMTVDEFCAIPGQVAKRIQNRVTRRVERRGRVFFIKCHRGVGWPEVLKNLASLRLPVVSASNEWRAIKRLHELGIDTMRGVAFGETGHSPAALRSFLVTESLEHTVDLEHWSRDFEARPDRPRHLATWRRLVGRVGELSGRMHRNGVNHRDYYLCHLRIDTDDAGLPVDRGGGPVYVMDLHRAQLRRRTPDRWAVKDLAGLLYSALHGPAGLRLGRTDQARFLRAYLGVDWKNTLRRRGRFWQNVRQRYVRYCRKGRHPPRRLLGGSQWNHREA